MILDLKMIPFLSVLLCVVIIQGAYGTFFPEVENPPPIPARGPPSFYAPQDLPQPKEEGIFPPDAKPDEERWYYEESQSREIGGRQRSFESFDRFENGEPATSHVATPIPDVEPIPQPSNIPNINPTDIRNPRNIFLLQRDADDQYQERWVQLQIPAESLLEEFNQDPGFQVATDTVKSIVAPASFDIPPKTQFPSNQAVNIVQVRPPNTVELQKVYTNYPRTVGNLPAEKQIVDIPPPPPLQPQVNTKRVLQQQIINSDPSVAIPLPVPAQIASKQSFVVPPPLPPPLKGENVPSKVFSSAPVNIIPDSNVIVSSKNIIPDSNIVPGKNVVQQLRHVWIPTSSKTGKFITIPVSGSINSGKSIVNKGFSLDSVPVTVSDTWVLKQDGRVPVFEQQKSALPSVLSPVVQSGKVIFQNPTIVQVDGPPHPVVASVDSPKNVPVVEKSVASNIPIDIWPVRKELTSPEKYGSYAPIVASGVPSAAVKSDALIIRKSSELLPAPQKTIDIKSPLPPPIPSQAVQVVNGKPCPLPLAAPQKSIFSPVNDGIISVPRISTQRRLPFARIIRVNRYPTGSYYLLNKSVKPSYFVYPSQAVIQQPKPGLIRVVQTKQLQRNIPAPPVQTKQISIPVQSKQISSPFTAKQIAYPYVSRQVILPVAPPQKSRILYPTVQAIRYVYPWNGYSSPILGKGVYVPEFSSLKSKRSKSESSSSESSSENSSSDDSSESSKEKKEAKSKKNKSREENSKKEKTKTEEKPESTENSSSSESEMQTESESNSNAKETESEETSSSEKESEESLETSESQTSLKFHKNSDESGHVTGENAYINLISNHDSAVGEETHFDEEKSN